MKNKKLIILAGPTASGKTQLAIDLALRINSEIISADSRLVYKYFDIGTAKPTKEERERVKHHLIDIVEPNFNYSAALFRDQAKEIINQMHQEDKIPIIAGGTGFYIRSVIDGFNIPQVEPDVSYRDELKSFAAENGNIALYNKLMEIDPKAAGRIHFNDAFRVIRALEVYKKTGKLISELQTKDQSEYDLIYVALNAENRDILYDRINKRVHLMIKDGLIDEVKYIIENFGRTLSVLKTLGYKEIIEYLNKKCTLDEAIENIQKNTRHFARRQLIWFRPDHRIIWYYIDRMSSEDILNDIIKRI